MAAPRCSVVIVTWNRLGQLQEALESVAHQTIAADLEIIVVDNGSTDGTAEWIASWPHPVTFAAYAGNRGSSVARNAAIRLATAPRICFMDSDAVLLDPNCIERCLQELDRGDVRAVACAIWFDAEKTRPFCLGGYITPDGHFDGRRTFTEHEDPHFISTCFGVWEKSLLEELRGFDPWYFWGIEDMDIALRAHFAARRGARHAATRFRILRDVNVHHNMAGAGRIYQPQDFDVKFRILERQRLYQVLAWGGPAMFLRVLLRTPFRLGRVERDAWQQRLSPWKKWLLAGWFPMIRLAMMPIDWARMKRNFLAEAEMPRVSRPSGA